MNKQLDTWNWIQLTATQTHKKKHLIKVIELFAIIFFSVCVCVFLSIRAVAIAYMRISRSRFPTFFFYPVIACNFLTRYSLRAVCVCVLVFAMHSISNWGKRTALCVCSDRAIRTTPYLKVDMHDIYFTARMLCTKKKLLRVCVCIYSTHCLLIYVVDLAVYSFGIFNFKNL